MDDQFLAKQLTDKHDYAVALENEANAFFFNFKSEICAILSKN